MVAPFAGSPQPIHVACDPELRLLPSQLAPLGGIIREAVANSLQHGFPAGRPGDVWVRLVEERGRLTLSVRDNGVGMPDHVGEPGSGRERIDALADELGGYARLGSAFFGGAQVTVVFRRAA
jgi:two-component sensor histidine kinase